MCVGWERESERALEAVRVDIPCVNRFAQLEY